MVLQSLVERRQATYSSHGRHNLQKWTTSPPDRGFSAVGTPVLRDLHLDRSVRALKESVVIAECDRGVEAALTARLRQGEAEAREASDTESTAKIFGREDIDVTVIVMVGFGTGEPVYQSCADPSNLLRRSSLIADEYQGLPAITGIKLHAFKNLLLTNHVESNSRDRSA